ncbi:MAG: cation:proton antiporter, partial [Pseudomonadota bacterium]
PGATTWALFAAKQLILGPAVGLVIGVVGGVVLLRAKAAETTSESFEGVGAVAMAGAAYLAAIAVGGNGFISAFVAGLAFGHIIQGQCKFVYEFTEGDGHMLSWGAFLLIGMVLVPEAIEHLTLATLGLILVSLIVVRPVAIWLSLIGTDASAPSRLFFGWFGPRGLATALFALLVVGQIDHAYAEPILAIAINAVWISAVLHGLSALPGARLYAARVADMGDCAERLPVDVSAKPLVTR